MKAIITTFLTFLFLTIGFSFVAYAQENWQVDNFKSNINIRSEGTVEIVETIQVDFRNQQKHGIYRDVPYVYQKEDGSKYYTQINVEEIMLNGQKVKNEISKNDANLRIKIGDADKTISGNQTYQIKYLATGILNSYESYDELYWNVTGNEWAVPINSSSATITLPKDSIIQVDCYQGYFGDSAKCKKNSDKKSAYFQSTRPLSANEGLTVAVGFEKGTVPILAVEPPQTFLDKISSPISIATFILAFLGAILFAFSNWLVRGRDSWLKSNEIIVVEFDPPDNLRPAELGTLVDERADTLDVSATIVDLASRGFLTITEQKKSWQFGKADYTLTRKKKDPKQLLAYENLLLDELFDTKDQVKLSELKNKFYSDLAKVKEELYKDVVQKKLFPQDPQKVRTKYLLFAIAALVGAIILIVLGANLEIGPLFMFAIGAIPGILIMIVFSRFMSRRTAYGRELYRRVKGYELFLSKAEKYRQQFFERKNLFNEILPYTIVLGLTEKFANAFKQLGLKPPQPSWYMGTYPFNATNFGQSINSFSNSLSSSIASAPRSSGSSGGGFSGGGGGGGGGGSW